MTKPASIQKPVKPKAKTKSKSAVSTAPPDIFAEYRRKWKELSPGWYAILTQDNTQLERLLKESAPKIIKENNTVSDLLGLALHHKNYEAADMLLSYHNARDFKNAMGQSAVHMAAKDIANEAEYDTAKNWLIKNNFDLNEAYIYEAQTYTFESIARKSIAVVRSTWVADYNPLFEEKPQWVKEKEDKAVKEKTLLAEANKPAKLPAAKKPKMK